MKKLFSLVAVIMAMLVAMPQANAQALSRKQQREIEKIAKKEAKKLTKEGWRVDNGALPIQQQLEKAYEKELLTDDEGYNVYITASEQAKGETIPTARDAAEALAKLNIAGQIETLVQAIAETTTGTESISPEEVASIQKVVESSKQTIAKRLGRLIITAEFTRQLPNKIYEVSVRYAYNQKTALDQAKEVVREGLKKEGLDLHKELDAMWSQK